MTRRAIVIGGSMGGMFAANFLHRAGWSVRVLEKSAVALTSRGTGIVTNDGLRTLLHMAGVDPDAPLGFEIRRRMVIDTAGTTLAQVERPQTMTAWSRLLGLLQRALPADRYHLGRTAIAVDPGDAQRAARVRLADGACIDADLVVVADGVRSSFRTPLFDAPPPVAAGYVAWRSLVPLSRLGDDDRAWIERNFVFALAPGEEIVAYPVLGEDGTVMVNVVWYRDTSDDTLRELLTDAAGRYYPDGIAPQSIRRGFIDAAMREARASLHARWSRILSVSTDWMLQVIVDSRTPRMNAGRVALVGDAAFVARPHVGQGVTKAGGDALALAEAVADPAIDVASALASYSTRRVPVGEYAVDLARRLGAVVYRDPAACTPDQSLHAAHYRDAGHLLADSAVELDQVANLGAVSARS
ncbi:MAG: FAD-dependent monooxygenase [Lautropia sp.]